MSQCPPDYPPLGWTQHKQNLKMKTVLVYFNSASGNTMDLRLSLTPLWYIPYGLSKKELVMPVNGFFIRHG